MRRRVQNVEENDARMPVTSDSIYRQPMTPPMTENTNGENTATENANDSSTSRSTTTETTPESAPRGIRRPRPPNYGNAEEHQQWVRNRMGQLAHPDHGVPLGAQFGYNLGAQFGVPRTATYNPTAGRIVVLDANADETVQDWGPHVRPPGAAQICRWDEQQPWRVSVDPRHLQKQLKEMREMQELVHEMRNMMINTRILSLQSLRDAMHELAESLAHPESLAGPVALAERRWTHEENNPGIILSPRTVAGVLNNEERRAETHLMRTMWPAENQAQYENHLAAVQTDTIKKMPLRVAEAISRLVEMHRP